MKIKEITLKNIASFGKEKAILSGLNKINIIYGNNGTGKTTISRLLYKEGQNPENKEKKIKDRKVNWDVNKNGESKPAIKVFNSDFITRNFYSETDLPGIFTIGEDNVDNKTKIQKAKDELKPIVSKKTENDNILESEKDKLTNLNNAFNKTLWDCRKKNLDIMPKTFSDGIGTMESFKKKILEIFSLNNPQQKNICDINSIKTMANIVFATNLKTIAKIIPIGIEIANKLLNDSNKILNEEIKGKSTHDFAILIEKLNNSDWIWDGIQYHEKDYKVCPFCQQATEISIKENLNDYFNNEYKDKITEIKKCLEKYKDYSKNIIEILKGLEVIENKELNNNSDLTRVIALANITMTANNKAFEDKLKAPSKKMQINSISNNIKEINDIIDEANENIDTNNKTVDNQEKEKTKLQKQFLDYLANECKTITRDYNDNIELTNLEVKKYTNIGIEINNSINEFESEIAILNNKITSIEPTIKNINKHLQNCGINSFKISKSENENSYILEREENDSVKDTISDGERSLFTFLYFYEQLNGYKDKTGAKQNSIVVIDDPISSLDYNALIYVVELIRSLFSNETNKPEMQKQEGNIIEQVFIFTHNLYFHNQVCFNKKKCIKYFVINQNKDNKSYIIDYDKNPIQTYEKLLWDEVKGSWNKVTIQNTLRRILERFFPLCGCTSVNKLGDNFDEDKKIRFNCFVSWLNIGSHKSTDEVCVLGTENAVNSYKETFKMIFWEHGYEKYYNYMMGLATDKVLLPKLEKELTE